MFTRPGVPLLRAIVILCAGSSSAQLLLAQQTSSLSVSAVVQEFPVTLQENVVAGNTPVGTKLEAKLAVATLLNGTVIPRNAVLSGEVIESVAKTATDTSRLAIRMDSVQWKNGTAAIKVFLTAWFYPTVQETGQNLQYGPTQSAKDTWNGQGQYPDPNSKIYRPFPGSDSGNKASVPDTPTSVTSNHRVQMKNVESEHNGEGALMLVSKHSTIKLDKLTTYVVAADTLQPGK